MLVIDQFEEVFTLVPDEAVRAHLLDSLVTAVLDERSRVRVVITLRADFIDRPLRYVDFGELLQRSAAEFVLPLTPDELEQRHRRPGRARGPATRSRPGVGHHPRCERSTRRAAAAAICADRTVRAARRIAC